MTARARLKNEFTEDEKNNNLMSWLNDILKKIASLTLHIDKKQNLYRIEWQTVIKIHVTSFLLALSLLCDYYWNMLFAVNIVSFCSYFNKISLFAPYCMLLWKSINYIVKWSKTRHEYII